LKFFWISNRYWIFKFAFNQSIFVRFNKKDKYKLIEFAKELKEGRLNSIDKNKNDWKDTVILQIDLSTFSYDIWRDHMYDKEDHCYFVKNNIPAKYIKKLYEV
jgi:hypothetical protein